MTVLHKFNNVEVSVTPTNDVKQWFMTVEQVAECYGVTRTAVVKHLTRHAEDFRDGIERGWTNSHTLDGQRGVTNSDSIGGNQRQVVLYREGVIKLGFFVRSQQAVYFRQWATDLICAVMDRAATNPNQLLLDIYEVAKRTEAKLDYYQGAEDALQGDMAEEIRTLVKGVSDVYKVDGKTVWGWVKENCDVNSYKKQNLKVANYLKNLLGKGLTLVKNTEDK